MLTSTKILSQRSAVPAVFSRGPSSSAIKLEKRKASAVTHDEKGRLLRMGKRLRRGPFGAFVDPNQVGEGSAMLELSEAAKKAGTYDVWSEDVPEQVAVKVRFAHARRGHPRAPSVLVLIRTLGDALRVGTADGAPALEHRSRGCPCAT